ncbi:MAG: 4-hydroxy-tetrahydrodipicolinate reductase [Bauldia sp.]|nr:4-hydroxy-tetrahydrodipicolinate reductase [Bauldia sp.]
MTDLRLMVAGASGRMGQTLIRIIAESPGVRLAAALERPGADGIGEDAGTRAGAGATDVDIDTDAARLVREADAILDFTTPAATVALAKVAARAHVAHVIGTTGFSPAEEAEIAEAARHTAIVKSGNMSLGVNLLARLVRIAATALDADFDIELAEMHHRHKVDAPSGTALLLAKAAAEGRGIDLASHKVTAREGQVGPRRRGDIGFSVMRGGSAVGDHSVLFAGEGEIIELSHRAFDRAIFARGAIKAALWTRGKKPGLYSMSDVLGIS